MIELAFWVFTFLSFLSFGKSQAIYKCSPVDGALETYTFAVGSDTGMACVSGAGTDSIIMYIERLLPTGERNIGVISSKYHKKHKKYVGHLHRLYPAGPKRKFTASSVPGFLTLNFNDGETLNLVLKPNGFPWMPADIRQINGCAMENPQIYLNVMDQGTMQTTKMMMCAMGKNSKSGYSAVYGFGLRSRESFGAEPFIYLGKTANPIVPNAPLNIIANTMDICLKPDCKLCSIGYKAITLSN